MKTITLQNSKRVALSTVAAICLASVTLGAQAGEPANDVPTRTVHYSDLNLNSPQGAAILYRRIRYAAEQVCGDVGSRRLEEAVAAKACVNRALFASVQRIDNPRLTSEYKAHFGMPKLIDLASAH